MAAHILIAYATRNGSTAEIAYAIGKELQAKGIVVTVADIRIISTVGDYTAVIIGAPLYMGRLPAEVPKFIAQYQDQLAANPVAAFAVGFAPLSKTPGATDEALGILKNTLAPLQPVISIVFAGKVDPSKTGLLLKKFMEKEHLPTGDHRDWNVIAGWAHRLIHTLDLKE